MYLPSIKTLSKVNPDKAREIRELLEKKRSTRTYASVQDWIKACYHEPRYAERLLCAMNEIIGGYGVEAIYRHEGDLAPRYEYINLGETYTPTIMRDCATGRIFVSDWGSIIERWN